MNHIRRIRRAASFTIAMASCLLGFVLWAPSAFAMVVEPIGAGSSGAVVPQTAPATGQLVVSPGMAGWQIALIAIGSALLTATLAVVADRARGSNRKVSVSAA